MSEELPLAPRDDSLVSANRLAGPRVLRSLIGYQFATRCVQVAGSILLIRSLAPEDVGLIAIGLMSSSLLNMLSDAGLSGAFIRQASEPSREQLGAGRIFSVATSVPLVAILLVVMLQLDLPPGGGLLIAAYGVSVVLHALQGISIIRLERAQAYAFRSRVEAVHPLVYFGVAVPLVMALDDLRGVAVAVIAAEVWRLVAYYWRERPNAQLLVAPRRVRQEVLALRWYQLDLLSGVLLGLAMTVMLSFIGLARAGLYNIAYRCSEPAVQLGNVVQRLVFPKLARMDPGPGRMEWVDRWVSLATIAATAPMLLIVANGAAVIEGIAGTQYVEAARVLGWVAVLTVVVQPRVYGSAALVLNDEGPRSLVRIKLLTLATLLALFGAVHWHDPLVAYVAGLVACGIVEFVLLGRHMRRRYGRELGGRAMYVCTGGLLLAAVCAADVAGLGGAGARNLIPTTAWCLLLALFCRPQVQDGWRVMRDALPTPKRVR